MKKSFWILVLLILTIGLACNIPMTTHEKPGISGEVIEAEDQEQPVEIIQSEEIVPTEPEQAETEAIQVDSTEMTESIEPGITPALPTTSGQAVRLIFIHHSSGENWLNDENGGLGLALMKNNYFVSDTNYGWGPDGIGDRTDIGNYWEWFAGPNQEQIMQAVFSESNQNSSYTRLETAPAGENTIIMFKSCFPNSALGGNPSDPAASGENPLRGNDASSEYHTVGTAKGIYNDLLAYFSTRPDKLFILITAPPLGAFATDSGQAENARALNRWLVEEWLQGYSRPNVAVFDFYDVLTSNAGNPDTTDASSDLGNHHRYWNGSIQYITDQGSNFSAYAANEDSHPTAAGNQKATSEFIPLLNFYYQRWLAAQP